MGKKDVSFSILDNGLNFIVAALEHIGKPKQDIIDNDIKYGIIHLWSGIELLLKARLQKEHWSLIIKDRNKGNRDCYHEGEFASVTFEESVKRLSGYCDTHIEEHKLSRLNELRRKRNKIVHLEFRDNKTALIPLVAKAVWFAIEFVEKELADDMEREDVSLVVGSLKRKVYQFDHFVSSRMRDIEPELKEAYRVCTCPDCGQRALCLGEHMPKCLFCGYTSDFLEEALGDYVLNILKVSRSAIAEGYYPVHRCSSCGEEAVVADRGTRPCTYVCINCGEENFESDFGTCARCQTSISLEQTDGLELCDDCAEYIFSRKD